MANAFGDDTAKHSVLIFVEMHTVDAAGLYVFAGIQEVAIQFGGDLFIGLGKPFGVVGVKWGDLLSLQKGLDA